MTPDQIFPWANTVALCTWLLLADWLHDLAFDLLMGNWQVRDARSRRHECACASTPGAHVSVGPGGVLHYSALRTARAVS